MPAGTSIFYGGWGATALPFQIINDIHSNIKEGCVCCRLINLAANTNVLTHKIEYNLHVPIAALESLALTLAG